MNYNKGLGLTSHTVCDSQVLPVKGSPCGLSYSVVWHLDQQFPQLPHAAICHSVNVAPVSLLCDCSSFSSPKPRRHSKINAIDFFSKPKLPGSQCEIHQSGAFNTLQKEVCTVFKNAGLLDTELFILTLQLALLYSSGFGSSGYELFPASFLLCLSAFLLYNCPDTFFLIPSTFPSLHLEYNLSFVVDIFPIPIIP